MTPQDWQFLKNSVITRSDILLSYRIVRGTSGATRKFALDPAPTGSARTLSYEYITDQWVIGAASSGKTAFAADTDQPIIDDFLIELGMTAYLKREFGMDYATDYAEYQAEVDRTYAQDVPRQTLDMGGNNLRLWGNIPEQGFGS